ncbi:arylformamidase [Peribacillus muralis]|uniref:arylformamidase n=1 Tax=Peribacillus muralis TaxID=264697 RepID=UPI003D04B690
MNEWIDISQPLNAKVAVWPGDTPFNYIINWNKEESGSVNVGKITMSVHTGTHIDAPFHFDNKGKKVAELEINNFIGKVRVVEITNQMTIGVSVLSSFDLDGVERLIIRTDAWPDRETFPENIPYIEEMAASYLYNKGIFLVGLDLPSLDPLASKELISHHQFSKYGINILEGLVLDKVNPGDYELIALPLSITEADGSPTRAVLRKY